MIALIDFVDLQDNKHLYHAGDKFPRTGARVSEERMKELSGKDNKLGQPLIGEKPKAKIDEIPSDDVKEYVPKKRGRKRAD